MSSLRGARRTRPPAREPEFRGGDQREERQHREIIASQPAVDTIAPEASDETPIAFRRYHNVMDTGALQQNILDFWFGPPPHASRNVWFRKDAAFDEAIRERFGAVVEAALGGGYRNWNGSAYGALARVLLLDQFTRNLFRDTPRAFAGDFDALATASAAVDDGHDRALGVYERWFLYLPFEHAEDPVAQERSLALFGALTAETGDAGPLEWAQKHAAIIRRFGRYPHRNTILGRASTPEEIAFLKEPGSRF